MIIQWKKIDALEFVAEWQGIHLSLKYEPTGHAGGLFGRAWHVSVDNAAACPDGTLVKGSWTSAPAAMEAVEEALWRVLKRQPAPSALVRKTDYVAMGLVVRHA